MAFPNDGGAAVTKVRRSGPRPAVDAVASRAPVTEDGILVRRGESIAKGEAINASPVAAIDVRGRFSDHGRDAYGAGVASVFAITRCG